MKMKFLLMLLVCAIAVPAVASFDFAALEDNQSNSNNWQMVANNVDPTLPASSPNTYGNSRYAYRADKDNNVSSDDVVVLKPGNGKATGFYNNGKSTIIVPDGENWNNGPVDDCDNGSNGNVSATPLPSSITLSLVGAGCIGLLRKRKIM